MRIAVIGAGGRTGIETTRLAVERGLEVIAVVRDAERYQRRHPGPPPAEVRIAEARDPVALGRAIDGVDAVIMCVGPVKGEEPTILAEAAASLIESMAAAEVRRLVMVTASGWIVDGDDPLSRYLAKPILARALRSENTAFEAAERAVASSTLAWTIVRPPMLTDGPRRGAYRSRRDGNVRWRYSIRRADLAVALLDVLDDETAVRRRISVAT
ncbi:putative NADH-flavin reductase [Actinoalloteichus hoggarensis]|uniref:NmrA-like family protein n=1 Tax=Actinoalloteichus hoggarensis TaxID=1470176 RepID=A0A221VZ99_9PSEU|nr:NAD(P)H-binding protein [Actinoalloteichus hoggarensis]ASO18867.1 NmrA-like family protein [Actinoalloteichus hoggarensis]MBB5920102.1 putative NADH-flavin reductase [Actinoalloteichus hoggarensis]